MKNLICFLMLAACIALFISCEKSTDTLIKAAAQGYAMAQYNLGVMYAYGRSVCMASHFEDLKGFGIGTKAENPRGLGTESPGSSN